jgi:hypothetical protein
VFEGGAGGSRVGRSERRLAAHGILSGQCRRRTLGTCYTVTPAASAPEDALPAEYHVRPPARYTRNAQELGSDEGLLHAARSPVVRQSDCRRADRVRGYAPTLRMRGVSTYETPCPTARAGGSGGWRPCGPCSRGFEPLPHQDEDVPGRQRIRDLREAGDLTEAVPSYLHPASG